jgi:uncharacterized protein (DUF488 family)
MSVKPTAPQTTVYTIGHSDLPIDGFIDRLRMHGITAVADVRSIPFSRRLPHFSRPALKAALKSAGIAYVFLGNELGARTADTSCYIEGRADYERIAETTAFASGLQRVEEGAGHYRVALMCAEREPLDCHRAVLVARYVAQRGIEVRHILYNGEIELHTETECRLVRLVRGPVTDLFVTDPQAELDEAYRIRGCAIAYTGMVPGNNGATGLDEVPG